MKRPVKATTGVLCGAVLLLALTAAQRPALFSNTPAGLWQIDRSNGERRRICLTNPELLAQYEHFTGKCTREVIRDAGHASEVGYSCEGGGFGQSKIEQITPRSLRIETQGISDNAPFHYVIQARRIGDC